ncbi:MAG: hypothetical protein GTO46_00400 [Gemmatimonadetes bacterium]|nr:hypothetical protein [Gemmatimonadota bacterium]NIO30250.1 hypothetical protein [Gemmatimonadota bacterium]
MSHALRLAIPIAIAIAIVGDDAAAQETRVDSLRTAHGEATARVSELVIARDGAQAWAERLYRLIPEAREQGTDALRQTLAVAQFAADSLDTLDALLAEALGAERDVRAALVVELESELARVLDDAELAPPIQKVALTQLAQSLASELAAIRAPLQLPATELPTVAVEPGDGPEEIALKADFLSDRATQLRNAADVVASEITRVERRGELQDEMRRLVAEVRLFDEAGLPPVAAEAGETENVTQSTFDQTSTRLGPGDVAVAPAGERALDLPILPVEADVQLASDEATLLDQLDRLREDLLRRAEVLDRQAEEFRRLIRGPP